MCLQIFGERAHDPISTPAVPKTPLPRLDASHDCPKVSYDPACVRLLVFLYALSERKHWFVSPVVDPIMRFSPELDEVCSAPDRLGLHFHEHSGRVCAAVWARQVRGDPDKQRLDLSCVG